MKPLPISEDDLQAWTDGRLPASRRATVEAYLADHPEQRDRLTSYRHQDEALRQLFQPVLAEDIPPRLSPRPATPAANWRSWPWQMAAGLLLALLGGLGGWQARAYLAPSPLLASLPQRAAVAHAVFTPEVRHPVEVGADQEAHLAAWLSKRLGTPLHPPQLGSAGFNLVGGRLLPGNQGPVAQFMYQDEAGHRLTLYISSEPHSGGDTAFRFAREGQTGVFYWVDNRLAYALAGDLERTTLAPIASLVYDQLEKQQP